MKKQLFQCNECEKMTPLVRKTDKLPDDIRHEYAECQQCGYKSTYFYSDRKLRNLLFKQSHTKHKAKKIALGKEINDYVQMMNNKYNSLANS